METERFSRRDFLRIGALATATAALAACAPATTPSTPEVVKETVEVVVQETVEVERTVVVEATQPPEPTAAPLIPEDSVEGRVVYMGHTGEAGEMYDLGFEDLYPGIDLEVLDWDQTRFFAMVASGAPPDLIRTQAPAIPQYLGRGLLYDLTPYFEVSNYLSLDDLAPSNAYYKGYDALNIGEGPIYGMCKDWSPDFTVFAYRPAFEQASIDLPSETTPLTYDEIFDLAVRLAQFEGDRTLMFGYGYGDWWVDRIWMNMLGEVGQSIFTEDFTKLAVSSNEEAYAVAKYYFDMAQELVVSSPLNPSPSWNGEDFEKGTLAMLQYGYWYSASAESDVTAGEVVMLPGPTWAGERRDPTITATGWVMISATEVPSIAWKVFEFYMGKEPATNRAKSGWGVPALRSLYELMPSETEYQQQVQRVLQGELALDTEPLRFNPFLGETTTADSWAKYLEPALRGEMTFDELLQAMESDVNLAIEEGIDRLL